MLVMLTTVVVLLSFSRCLSKVNHAPSQLRCNCAPSTAAALALLQFNFFSPFIPLADAATNSIIISGITKEFTSPDGKIHFKYPEDFIYSEKPVKTHGYEALFKSEIIKGYIEGITVDKVKIDSIIKFASPKELGDKVVNVEKAKDGNLDAVLIKYADAEMSMDGLSPAYELEYKVESTRGRNHFFVKTSIIGKRLYVFTVQCDESKVDAISEEAKQILDSVKVDL